MQIGAIGLIKAVDRYDAGRGVALDVYAVPAIAGEIRHHLRDRCEPVRVPRRQRADGVRVQPSASTAWPARPPTRWPARPIGSRSAPPSGPCRRVSAGSSCSASSPTSARRRSPLASASPRSTSPVCCGPPVAKLRVQMLTTSTNGQMASVAEEAAHP